MNRGVKAALLISCAGVCGCSARTSGVEVRPIANSSAALARGGDAIAVARGQLVLGNVGLALEGFRKAQRENPASAAALAGIGDCYSAMSRFDLAQSNYEAALALAPHDRTLLLGLAAVFERGGQPMRAMAVRAEANAIVQPAPAAATVATAAAVAAVETRPVVMDMVTIAPQPPAPVATSVIASVPQAVTATTMVLPKVAAPAAAGISTAPPEPALAARVEQAVRVPAPSIGSVTVELPPARPAHRLEAQAPVLASSQFDDDDQAPASSVTVALPPARPAPVAKREAVAEHAPMMAQALSPRLERLTSGEVALVTTGKPIWNRPQNLLAAASSVRWVALARPGTRPNIQILNAARSQGLAASARAVLLDRGWRKLDIGDAPAIEAKSVVLYPKGREKLGKSLAAQFGIAARMVERDVLVLVLGRDSVDRISGPRKS
jgi:tetratricopeptide (TPR) repeat protein